MEEKPRAHPTPKGARKTNSASPLPADLSVDNPHNWNFDKVTQRELVPCRWWEYMRESASLRVAVTKANKAFRENVAVAALPLLVARNENIGEDFPLIQSPLFTHGVVFHVPFPTPWQSLNIEHKERCVTFLTPQPKECRCPPPFERWWDADVLHELYDRACKYRDEFAADLKKRMHATPSERRTMSLARSTPDAPVIRYGGLEHLAVRVNWRDYTNDDIAEYMRKWARLNRPKDIPQPDDRGHNREDSRRADLTRLAAMRLLSRYSPKEIGITRHKEIVECEPIRKATQFASSKWDDPTKWRDAKRKARQLFHELSPYLADCEDPLSYERQK